MAQDFGDDLGERLFRLIGRAASYAVRDWMREREYARRLAERDGGQRGAEKAEEPAQPEEVCIPFGQADDAALFAKVCQEEGVQMDALADKEGNGFVRFRTEDLEKVQACSERYVDAMTRMNAERVARTLESALPVTEEQMRGLTQIKDLPDLPGRESAQPVKGPGHGAAARDGRVAAGELNHTETIAREVERARGACRDFDDFKDRLAERGIGVTTTKDGEVMFYEARRDGQGSLLPFGRDEATGNRDWAVGAKALKERYNIDATHDWFERNTPQAADGSLDMDGRTPDINQGIDSHDGMDICSSKPASAASAPPTLSSKASSARARSCAVPATGHAMRASDAASITKARATHTSSAFQSFLMCPSFPSVPPLASNIANHQPRLILV